MIAIVTTNSTLAAQYVHVLNSAHTLARLTRASVLGMLSARDVHVLTSANTLARLTHASVLACQTVVWSAQYVHVLISANTLARQTCLVSGTLVCVSGTLNFEVEHQGTDTEHCRRTQNKFGQGQRLVRT